MKAINNKTRIAFAVLMLASTAAMAQKANDTVVGIGVAVIAPRESLESINSVGPAGSTFNMLTRGASVSIGSATTVSFSVLHMFTDNIAAELTIGVPPELKVDITTATGTHTDAAKVKELTPALVAKYLFNSPADALRPYLGLGVTRATFRGETVNMADPQVAALSGSSLSLSSSWAPVYNAGAIYNFTERLSVNASISYIPLKTTATMVGAGPGTGTVTTAELKLNPIDYVVRLGYKF